MFGFIKVVFFTRLTVLSTLFSVNPLECVSINNQEYKVRPEIVNLIVMSLYLIVLVLKQVYAVVVVTTSSLCKIVCC